MEKIRVALLYGGFSSERQISLKTGKRVLDSLEKEKYSVIPIDVDDNFQWLDYLVSIKKEIDIVFVAMHGRFGEDGIVQGILETVGIPYTGSGVLASALGMNKVKSRKLFEQAGLSVPKYLVVNLKEYQTNKEENVEKISKEIGYPCIVKPNCQGSSLGVSLINNIEKIERGLEDAFGYDANVLIEKFITGTELTAGVLGNSDDAKTLISLPLVEIIPDEKFDFFEYEAKYKSEAASEIVPARIGKSLTKIVQEQTVRAYKSLGGRGFGRVDLILLGDTPYILEVNTIPGMTETSLFPKAALAYGFDFPQLLEEIIKLGMLKLG